MSTNDILERTANALAATTVFGRAHEHNGITVIPATAIRGGAGGGGGTSYDDSDRTETTKDSGEGGGFGFMARPAGALVIDGDDVSWKAPPLDVTRIIIGGELVAVAYFFFAWLIARTRARS